MTKGEIKAATNGAVDATYPELTDTDELTAAQNTVVTDNVAAALASVNPIHQYPAANK